MNDLKCSSICFYYSLVTYRSSTIPRETMVSRRKILSRSRDDLNLDQGMDMNDEEDVWYQKEKLFKVSIIFYVFDKFNTKHTKIN